MYTWLWMHSEFAIVKWGRKIGQYPLNIKSIVLSDNRPPVCPQHQQVNVREIPN